jgi:YARHG domain
MRVTTTVATMALAAATLGAAMSLAYSQSCQELWFERNSYYKEAGYCFKTARAIRAFGNAGCQYDREGDLPLSRGIRARIAQIVRLERALGCS